MEIVSQAANFLKLLFTPCKLYIDKKKNRVAKYGKLAKAKRGDLSGEDKEWVDRCRRKNWDSFDHPETEGKPNWSGISNQFWDELDELNGKQLDGLKMFSYWRYDETGQPDFDKSPYWDEVRKLLVKYAVDSEERDNLQSKLRWYKSKRFYKERLWTPMLTPKMLEALATNINKRAKAYEEVSDPACLLTLYFICVVYIHFLNPPLTIV